MRAGKIYFPDNSARVKGEIADGCEVIEFGKSVARYLKLHLDSEQLFVLQLQFDLLSLKLLLDSMQFVVLQLQLDLLGLKLLLGSDQLRVLCLHFDPMHLKFIDFHCYPFHPKHIH